MNIENIILRLNSINDKRFYDFTLISKADIETTRSITSAIECHTELGNKKITLLIGLPSRFPYVLPYIFLKEREIFPCMVPHIEKDGYICYLSSEGLLLNPEKTDGILIESLELAYQVLADGMSGKNRSDLYNEFEAFWRRIEKTKQVASLVHPQAENGYKRFFVWSLDKEKKLYPDLIFCDSMEDGKDYAKQIFETELTDDTVQHGFFLTLRPSTYIDIDKVMRNFSPKTIRNIVKENLSGSVSRRFFNLIKSKRVPSGGKEYLLLRVPQPDGNFSLIGVEFSGFHSRSHKGNGYLKHPLAESLDYSVNLVPLKIERHYQEHLVLRTGGETGLIGKRVAVLGVGAVGSRIAGELIHAGVNDITLIDEDCISTDNLYRHEVGTSYLYLNKAVAVATHLKYKYPRINITYKVANVYDILTSYPDMFEKFDLIISAMGNPTIEMFLNRKLRELEKSPPTIFTWVEPLGIGGHVLATLNNNRKGCFECLHTNPSGPTLEYINRASFSAPHQTFSKTVAGCGTQFTPYASLDALQTAILATRLAIDILKGIENDNPLLSWKGDASTFTQAGFSLSTRYELPQETMFENRYIYKTNRCPICGI